MTYDEINTLSEERLLRHFESFMKAVSYASEAELDVKIEPEEEIEWCVVKDSNRDKFKRRNRRARRQQ